MPTPVDRKSHVGPYTGEQHKNERTEQEHLFQKVQ